MRSKLFLQKGQTLIEVIVVAGLLTMVLVAVVSSVTTTVSRNTAAKDSTLAVRHAQEGLDWVRYWRDSFGWQATLDAFGDVQTRCLNGDNFPPDSNSLPTLAPDGPCTYYDLNDDVDGEDNDNGFKREVTSKHTADGLEIVVKVYQKGDAEPVSEVSMKLRERYD